MMSQKCGKPLAKRRCGSDIGSCQSKVNDGKFVMLFGSWNCLVNLLQIY